MPFALNLIYLATLLVFAPCLVYRMVRSGKYREGLWEKFSGEAPRRIGDRPCLWFHAVSVGEVLLLRPLVQEMARRRPNWEVVISTTTPTGLAVARRTFPDLITFYAPLDFSWATAAGRWRRVRPTVLALVELELWPNLIRAAKQSGRQGGDHQRPAQRAKLSGISQPARPAGNHAAVHRRRGGAGCRLRPQVRRSGRSRGPDQRHRLGQVRRPGKRPEQRPDARPSQATGPVALRPRLRGRQHDGRRGGRGAGRVPVRSSPAPAPAPDPGAPACRAVRQRRRLARGERRDRWCAAPSFGRGRPPAGHDRARLPSS